MINQQIGFCSALQFLPAALSTHLNSNIRFLKRGWGKVEEVRDVAALSFFQSEIKRLTDGISLRRGELFKAESCQGVSVRAPD